MTVTVISERGLSQLSLLVWLTKYEVTPEVEVLGIMEDNELPPVDTEYHFKVLPVTVEVVKVGAISPKQ